MNSQPIGKTAVISGGAGGLGLALVERLASKDFHIAVLDFHIDKLALVKRQFEDKVKTFQVDVTDAKSVKKAVDEAFNYMGSIAILVNCAGITGATGIKSHFVDLKDFERVMQVNVLGCLTTFQAVVPYMLEKNYGRVLHIASIAGKDGNAGMLSYSTSKAAVIGMTKVQGKEYAGTGITVNALAPAVIRTPILDDIPEHQIKYMTDKIPMKRCGTTEEFAAMAEFIVSDENSFCTGFTFDLTGGRSVY